MSDKDFLLGPILMDLADIYINGQMNAMRETVNVTFYTEGESHISGICVCFDRNRFEYNFPPRRSKRIGGMVAFTHLFFNSRNRNKSVIDREADIILGGWDSLTYPQKTEFISAVHMFLYVNRIVEGSLSEYRKRTEPKRSDRR